MALTKITSKMTDDTIPQKTAHGAMKLPVGATGQRPTGEAGDLRYNSTTGEFEGYTTEWGSIGGDVDTSSHGSLTPTVSSPADNTVVIGNYSSYSNPTFALFLGTTPLPFNQENNTLTITSYPQTGSQTITVRAAHGGGSIFSTVATVSVNIVNPAARYWRLTNWSAGSSYGIRMGYLKMWTGLNGTGSAPASASDAYISANIWSHYPSYESYYGPDKTRTLPFGGSYKTWNRLGSQVSVSNWIKLDMQSPVLINSIDFAWTNNSVYYYGADNMGLQKSYDDVNWIDVIHFGDNIGLPANTVNTNVATGSLATMQAARNNVAQFNRTDEWAL